MKIVKLVILHILTLSIFACGFQLRGTTAMPSSIQRLAIEPDEPYLPLQREVRELLRYNGITIVSTTQKPDAILYILTDDFVVADTSIGADGRIREKSYNYKASFKVTTPDGNTLIEPQQVNSMRLIEFNPDLALAQTMEAQIIEEENRSVVANQIVNRLAYAASKPIEEKVK